MAREKTIWSVGGGKGGIGKSVATVNIGCALAGMGKEVILVDADLGGANIHTYFGIKYPPKGLDDFIKGRVKTLNEAAIPTLLPNLRIISGASEFLGIANPAYAQKEKIIRHIKSLEADYIIVDLGAGSSYNVLDFFAISNEGIIVLIPEPAAIQNAYIFLKSFVYRTLSRLFAGDAHISGMIKDATDARSPNSVKSFSDLCGRIAAEDREAAGKALDEIKSYRPRLLLNMASSKEDLKVVDAFRGAAKTFLSIEAEPVGALYYRPSVKAAARRMRPFMLDKDALDAHADMDRVISTLLCAPAARKAQMTEETAKTAPAPESAPPAYREQEVFGFNDNVSHQGSIYHVQTEVQGGAEPSIETIIYNGGRIFFSKRTGWKQVGGNESNGPIKAFAQRQHRAAMAAIKLDKITFQG